MYPLSDALQNGLPRALRGGEYGTGPALGKSSSWECAHNIILPATAIPAPTVIGGVPTPSPEFPQEFFGPILPPELPGDATTVTEMLVLSVVVVLELGAVRALNGVSSDKD